MEIQYTGATPYRAHPDDAGLDLFAAEDIYLTPGAQHLVRTGTAVAIPAGHVGLICPRSGLAHQTGVTVLNAPGVIDAGYRGELLVNLVNHSSYGHVVVKTGDRIAQLLILPIVTPTLCKVDQLAEGDRGDQGHGSTGH